MSSVWHCVQILYSNPGRAILDSLSDGKYIQKHLHPRKVFNILTKKQEELRKQKQLYEDLVHGGDRGTVEGKASDDEAEGGKS